MPPKGIGWVVETVMDVGTTFHLQLPLDIATTALAA